MSDNLTKEQRRRNMANIRSRHTKPEMIVRSVIHRMGYRFGLHDKRLPGRPDIVLARHRKVVLVHGCFWHRHQGCKRCTTPGTNQDYWIPKLTGNANRDKTHEERLLELGWEVLVVWECQTKDEQELTKRVELFLDENSNVKAPPR